MITLIGFLTANIIGRSIVSFGERLLDRMPLVRNVYSGLKQIFETVLANRTELFSRVGLFEYPRKGAWSIVFIAAQEDTEINDALEKGRQDDRGVPPDHAQRDDGLPAVCAGERRHPARHERRGRRKAARFRPDWLGRNTRNKTKSIGQGGSGNAKDSFTTTSRTGEKADDQERFSRPATAAPPRRVRKDRAAAAALRRAPIAVRDRVESSSRASSRAVSSRSAWNSMRATWKPGVPDWRVPRSSPSPRSFRSSSAIKKPVLGLAHHRQPRASPFRRAAPCRAARRSTACRRGRHDRATGAAAQGRNARHAR